MLENLVIGTLVISATALVHTLSLIALTHAVGLLGLRFRLHIHQAGQTLAMICTVLGLFLAHTIEVWIWAFVYLSIGALDTLEGAVYFSTASFSTLGYGDVVLGRDWRLLGSLEGVNGFILIGWSTAYLVAASTRLGPFRSGEHF